MLEGKDIDKRILAARVLGTFAPFGMIYIFKILHSFSHVFFASPDNSRDVVLRSEEVISMLMNMLIRKRDDHRERDAAAETLANFAKHGM